MSKTKLYSTGSEVSVNGTHQSQSRSGKKTANKHKDYTSEGVSDNDVFLLPGSDYQAMIILTLVGAVVRLFRIYQPSSVVFDEVQYVEVSILDFSC